MEEDEEAAFQVGDDGLAEEQVKVVGSSGKVKRTQTSGPQKDLNKNDSYILPLDIDNAKSDISSVVDTSMLPSDEEDNGNTARPTQTVRKSWAKKSLSRNAKYTAERPTIVTATASKGDHPGGLSKSFQTDLNSGWDASTHLVYPNQQRTISMTAQEQSIKDVLREAILLATGLTIFQNAFALSDRQLVDSRNSILSAAASLKYPQIAHRFEQDRGFAKHLTNYVTGRIGNMRGQVKEVAQKVVPSLYGIHQVPIEDGQRKRFFMSRVMLPGELGNAVVHNVTPTFSVSSDCFPPQRLQCQAPIGMSQESSKQPVSVKTGSDSSTSSVASATALNLLLV
ncbi:hypothetical protein DFH05DRAFT_1554439 [Lentinula detonsa]|uniref:DUF6532 domain-containing protein n=1 Tax=Lentinula detonsa TaxID=2804962 RepID=A0A9W8U0X8_9AGAR|nr:hypothetical protein DFH05DRAFT_1554439 [Lentinula detonsa]